MRTINSFVPLLVALTIAATTTHVPPARAASPELHYYATSLVRYAAKRSNVRAGPGTGYEKVGLLEAGEKVHVMAKTGNWFKLTPQGGAADRFVYAPLLTAARPESGTGATPSAAERFVPGFRWATRRANVRSGPKASHSRKFVVEPGEEARAMERHGDWLHVLVYGKGLGYVHASLLTNGSTRSAAHRTCRK